MRRYYLTATHIRRVPGEPRELPFGTAHVRTVGAAFTACGEPCFQWPIFWDVGIEEPEDACPECRWTAQRYDRAAAGLTV